MSGSEKNKIKLENVILLIAVCIFSLLLSGSILLLHRQVHHDPQNTDPDELLDYAQLYMEGQTLEQYGRLYDCSAYTRKVFRHFGFKIPLTSYEQFREYGGLPAGELQKGDLVFFNISGKGVSHVGIYLGENRFMHSPGINRYVRMDSLSNSYFQKYFMSGGRVIFKP